MLIIVLIVIAVLSLLIWDKRYKANHGKDIPEGFEKTEEVIIDPTNRKKLRVYYNSNSGERFYHEE